MFFVVRPLLFSELRRQARRYADGSSLQGVSGYGQTARIPTVGAERRVLHNPTRHSPPAAGCRGAAEEIARDSGAPAHQPVGQAVVQPVQAADRGKVKQPACHPRRKPPPAGRVARVSERAATPRFLGGWRTKMVISGGRGWQLGARRCQGGDIGRETIFDTAVRATTMGRMMRQDGATETPMARRESSCLSSQAAR